MADLGLGSLAAVALFFFFQQESGDTCDRRQAACNPTPWHRHA